LEEFVSSEVYAVVVGGFALALNSRPRATKDIDLLLDDSPTNLDAAARALARFGAPAIDRRVERPGSGRGEAT
jgi:hypothetical protein